jgi:hypothetical protein
VLAANHIDKTSRLCRYGMHSMGPSCILLRVMKPLYILYVHITRKIFR